MSGTRNPLRINGVPVVAAPAGIDLAAAGRLRTVVPDKGAYGPATIVADMSPRFRRG